MAALKEYMLAKYHELQAITNVPQLAGILGASEIVLHRLRFEKPYVVFDVKKQNGKSRLIESPEPELKKVLHELNGYLQCAYFFNRTNSAYGFVQQPRNANKKRNILTNAFRHCGKKYLLTLDLEDFFHQISRVKVVKIFMAQPFNYSLELSNFLSELVTYKNRLPMGSPTSPSLSNFATIQLDRDLEKLCHEQKITYTRYVDDLCFSSCVPIENDFFETVKQILTGHSYRINSSKIKWMREPDCKIVTGLILAGKPQVPASFLEDLEKGIARLKNVLEFSAVSHQWASGEWVQKYKLQLMGKLRFLKMIYGYNNKTFQKMNQLYNDAFNTQPFIESFNWNSFPYF